MKFFSRSGSVDPAGLRELALFRGLTDDELVRVAKPATRREIASGTTFIDQGRVGLECYAIAEGSANVYMNGQYVTSVGPGVMVGEMALVEKRPRNATVIAESDMTVVVFATSDLLVAFEESPELEERIRRTLERRLDENDS